MEHVARLFGEAWERRRQRRRNVAWLVLALCATVLLTYALLQSQPAKTPVPAPPTGIQEPAGAIAQSPAAVFSQAPYMGVLCPVANSIACDRVGLAIWLKHPASSVTASIDGHAFPMDRYGDRLVVATRRRREFDGYLRPAGIESRMHIRPIPGTSTWYGNPTTSAAVRLLINYGHGRYVTTHLQVPLAAGWG